MKRVLVVAFILGWAASASALVIAPKENVRVASPDPDRATVTVANAAGGNVVFCQAGQNATTASVPQVPPNTSGVFTTPLDLFCMSPLGTTITVTETLLVNTPLIAKQTCGSSTVLLTTTQTRNAKRITFINEGATIAYVCDVTPCSSANGVGLVEIGNSGQFEVLNPKLTQWFCTGSTAVSAVVE